MPPKPEDNSLCGVWWLRSPLVFNVCTSSRCKGNSIVSCGTKLPFASSSVKFPRIGAVIIQIRNILIIMYSISVSSLTLAATICAAKHSPVTNDTSLSIIHRSAKYKWTWTYFPMRWCNLIVTSRAFSITVSGMYEKCTGSPMKCWPPMLKKAFAWTNTWQKWITEWFLIAEIEIRRKWQHESWFMIFWIRSLTATSLENMLFVCNTMELKFRIVSNSKTISTGFPDMPRVSFRHPTHS